MKYSLVQNFNRPGYFLFICGYIGFGWRVIYWRLCHSNYLFKFRLLGGGLVWEDLAIQAGKSVGFLLVVWNMAMGCRLILRSLDRGLSVEERSRLRPSQHPEPCGWFTATTDVSFSLFLAPHLALCNVFMLCVSLWLKSVSLRNCTDIKYYLHVLCKLK